MTTIEERIQALEERECYDDTDLKEKIGYNDIPENSNIQAEIDNLKANLTSSGREINLEEDTIYTATAYASSIQLTEENAVAKYVFSIKEIDMDFIFITFHDIGIPDGNGNYTKYPSSQIEEVNSSTNVFLLNPVTISVAGETVSYSCLFLESYGDTTFGGVITVSEGNLLEEIPGGIPGGLSH